MQRQKQVLLNCLFFLILWGASEAKVYAIDKPAGDLSEFLAAYRQGEYTLAWQKAASVPIESLNDSLRLVFIEEYINLFKKHSVDTDSLLARGKQISDWCGQYGYQQREIYARTHLEMARLWYYKNELDSALSYLNAAHQYFGEDFSPRLYRNYYNFYGVLYGAKGENQIAYEFLERAYDYALKTEGTSFVALLAMKHNLATLARKSGKTEKAILIYREMEKHAEALKPYWNKGFDRFTLYRGIAWMHAEETKYDSALIYLDKALHCFNGKDGQRPLNYLRGLKDEVEYLRQLGELSKAEQKYEKLVQLLGQSKHAGAKKLEVDVYTDQALAELGRSDWKKALALLEKAEACFDQLYEEKAQKRAAFNFNQLAYVHWYRAKAYREAFRQSGKSAYLDKAQTLYLLAARQIQSLRKTMYNHNDKAKLMADYYALYEEALNCTFSLWKSVKQNSSLLAAFELIEANHSAILSDHKEMTYSKNDSIKEEEAHILSQRSLLLNSELPDTVKQDSLQRLNVTLRLLNTRYMTTLLGKQENIKQHVGKLKQLLEKEQTAYMSFFMGNKSFYLVVVTGDRMIFERISMHQLGESLQAVFNALHRNKSRYMAFNARKEATTLYRLMLAPFESEIGSIDQLIVAPSGLLTYVPFEMMIDEDGEFLIHRYTFHYTLSSKEWLKSLSKDSLLQQKEILAMAPFALEDTTVQPIDKGMLAIRSEEKRALPYSLNEVRQISEFSQVGSKATKAHFLEKVSDCHIIHLATHAEVNNKEPEFSHIMFYPEDYSSNRLFAHEIASMSLPNARIVSLSACQTGDGRWQKGEGVMSLSRAFAYAGASNTLMTHWIAEDKATAFIFRKFYEYVEKGIGKADALRSAKLDFMANPEFEEQAINPFYWANVQLVGNNKSLLAVQMDYKWYFELFIAFLIGTWLVFKLRSNLIKH